MSAEDVLRSGTVELERADRLLDVAMVARRINRCEEQVRRYIRRGYLKAQRIRVGGRGGNYQIRESDVDALVQHLATSVNTHTR